MSMIGMFRHLSPRAAEVLRAEPELVAGALEIGIPVAASGLPLYPQFSEFLRAVPEDQRAAFEARLDETYRELMKTAEGSPVGKMLQAARSGADSAIDSLEERGVAPEDFGEPLSVEKAWHGLHFLLTGSAHELEGRCGAAVLGGEELGEDLGYGPVRLLPASAVAAIAMSLADTPASSLELRFDPSAMNGQQVYPGGWEQGDALKWIIEAFESVRGYYAEARTLGRAMLLYLT